MWQVAKDCSIAFRVQGILLQWDSACAHFDYKSAFENPKASDVQQECIGPPRLGKEQWHTVTTRADDTDAYPDSLYPKTVAKSWRKKRTPTASASIVTTPEVLRELGVDNQNEKAKADCLAKWRAALGKKDLFMRQKLDNIKKSFARAGWTVDAPQAASAASTRAPDDSEDDGIVSMDDASNGVASDGDFDEDENAVYRRGGPAPARPPSVPGPPRPASPPPAQPPPQQPRSAPPVPAETALGPQPASPAVRQLRLASQPSGSGPEPQESRLDLRRRHLVRQMYRRRRRVRRCSAAPDGAQAICYM